MSGTVHYAAALIAWKSARNVSIWTIHEQDDAIHGERRMKENENENENENGRENESNRDDGTKSPGVQPINLNVNLSRGNAIVPAWVLVLFSALFVIASLGL